METKPNELVHSFAPIEHAEGNYNGLTKREYYAGLAMQGLCSDQTYLRPNNGEEIAQRAVEMADFLIAELNKPI